MTDPKKERLIQVVNETISEMKVPMLSAIIPFIRQKMNLLCDDDIDSLLKVLKEKIDYISGGDIDCSN